MINRNQLLPMMMDSLRETMEEEGVPADQSITGTSPLLAGAVVSSIGLVSVVTEIEMRLAEEFDVEVTLVSEEALSRTHSPFQNMDALADYILELCDRPNENQATPEPA